MMRQKHTHQMNSYLNIRLTGNAFISTLLMKFAGQGTGCRLNSAYLLLFSLRKPQTAYFKIDRDLVKKNECHDITEIET